MRVLTDWQRGTPPRPGLWLMRPALDPIYGWGYGIMLYWNGQQWTTSNGLPWDEDLTDFEWRGLAFDPQTAEIIPDADTPYGERKRYGYWIPLP